MSLVEHAAPVREVGLDSASVRELNTILRGALAGERFRVSAPASHHNIAVGLDADLDVEIDGHAGYYCAGMNQHANVRVLGSCGVGVAENMMSGRVDVVGNAGQAAGATARGGLLVVHGNAAARCAISLKGADIVVAGSVGHASGFMAQKGRLVVLGDAGDGLGDSIYEARLYVRGEVAGLGADCIEKPLRDEHRAELAELLAASGLDADPGDFRRYGSARGLYHFKTTRPTPAATDGHPDAGLPAPADARTAAPPDPAPTRPLPPQSPRLSATFDPATIAGIQRAAEEGVYAIRGWGAKRAVPHFDDLLFLGASMSRYPLEGYREHCGTDVVLGTRHAARPMRLSIPVTIAGMSFGALSAQAKEALGRGATLVGTSTTTGDGGMTPEERLASDRLVYQLLPSRYGMNPDDLRRADAIEIVLGQGAKPGGGGMLLGQKISARVAEMRDLPAGIDQRSACRHPDWTGPDDLTIKIAELREITDWQVPIFIKIGASRPFYDVSLAVKAGADVVVLDGMQGGTAASQEVFIEHVGIPILAAIRPAVEALTELGVRREVQLVVSGGVRNGADVAKAIALGADAVSVGVGALIALGDNAPGLTGDYAAMGTIPGAYDAWHEGRDPAGISTQDPDLAARLDPQVGAQRIANWLGVLTLEAQTIARACGKSHLHNLEPEDLVALTVEASAMARVPLAGTNWIPGPTTTG
ncbi:MAG TPA: glutamate synthase-related protein [Solirubrobacteraceae bacterium]|nr:glutamate synthase-related protein [Solirubrobacteraceae bacterium]